MLRNAFVGCVLLALACSGIWFWQGEPQTSDNVLGSDAPRDPDGNLPRLKLQAGRLEPLQQPIGKILPGDWLESHDESGQTFSQFLEVRPNPVARKLTTFYIQPIGSFTKTQQKLLAATAEGLEVFYGRKVNVLKNIELAAIPADARRINSQTKRPQVLTTYLMDQILSPKRPEDAIAVLALSAEDLWPGKGWNFVFGQASLTERVGVWSIARYGNPDDGPAAYQKCLERMLATAFHESGHMLGIPHCTAWNCCMNGSNNLEESDRRPLWFCSECQPKVWWSCSLKPEPHLADMVKFAEQQKLKSAAQHWRESKQAIQAP